MNLKGEHLKGIDIGPYIQLHMTRCILCYPLYVRCRSINQQKSHGILDRGDHSEIATYIQKRLKMILVET